MGTHAGNRDVIDAEYSSGGVEIPAKMYEKVAKIAEKVGRVRIQVKGSDDKSHRFWDRARGVSPVGCESPEVLCQIALDLVRAHAGTHPDDGAEYRAVFDYHLPDGKIVPKYAKISAEWHEDGLDLGDGVDESYETERERILAAALDAKTQEAERAGHLLLDTWDRYTSNIEKMGTTTARLVEAQAKVGESMAENQSSVARAMYQAGEMFQAGQARNVEQERLKLEADLMGREMDQSEQKWGMLQALLPPGIMMALTKAGVPPDAAASVIETMAKMIAAQNPEGMQGAMAAGMGAPAGAMGGAPPMAAMQAPQGPAQAAAQATPVPAAGAPQAPAQAAPAPGEWAYPGEIDLDGIDGEGAAFQLGLWFAERDEHEERAVRKIVSGPVYDTLRAACTQGDRAAGDALRDFGQRVQGLQGMQKIQLFGQLSKVLGNDGVGAFKDLVGGAQSGRL